MYSSNSKRSFIKPNNIIKLHYPNKNFYLVAEPQAFMLLARGDKMRIYLERIGVTILTLKNNDEEPVLLLFLKKVLKNDNDHSTYILNDYESTLPFGK